MALALSPVSPAITAEANGTTFTSPAFSPPAGALIVVFGWGHRTTNDQSSADIDISNNGTAITWDERGKANRDSVGRAGVTAAWTHRLTAARTGMTVTVNTSNAFQGGGLKVYVLTDTSTTTPVGAVQIGGSGTTVLNTTPVAAQATGSIFLFGASDDADVGTTLSVPTSNNSTFVADTTVTTQGVIAGYRTGPSAGQTVSFHANANSGSGTEWTYVVVEVRGGSLSLAPGGVPSGAAVGTPTVVPGQVTVGPPTSVPSAAAVGTPTVTEVQVLRDVGGVPSAAAAGTPTATPGAAVLAPGGIPSGVAFGTPTVVPGVVTVTQVAGIPSAESVGIPRASFGIADVDLPRAFPRQGIPYPQVQYELVCVARVPQVNSPPLLLQVDPIDWTGLSITDELSKPQRLDAGCKVSSLTEPVVQRLRNLSENATELWLYRNGKLVFAGPLLGWQVQGEALTLQCLGLLAYLRFMIVTRDLVYSGVDQHMIVRGLVEHWQNQEFGNYGINTDSIAASGMLRDATYLRNELHPIGQRVDELGRRANGFDIEVDPQSRDMQLWFPQQGVDRSTGEDAIIFDQRNVTSGNIVCSAAPGDVATEAFVTGTNPQASVYSYKPNAELRPKFGRAAVSATYDLVSEQATADAYAQGLVESRSQALLVPGPNLRTTTDAAPDGYDVGDTVSYELHERLGITGAFRIRKRVVSVSKTGREQSAIEFV